MNKLAWGIATMVGIGYLPASGTWASAFFAGSYYFFIFAIDWQLQLVLIICATAIAIWSSERTAAILNKKDPKEIVIDECVGMWIALVFVPYDVLYIFIVFVLFRLLDIYKPSVIGWADRNLRGGWGIMADDIIAGIFCAVAVLAVTDLANVLLLP